MIEWIVFEDYGYDTASKIENRKLSLFYPSFLTNRANMNKRLVLWSITVGLGGFLFGPVVAVFPMLTGNPEVWGLSDWLHGIALEIN